VSIVQGRKNNISNGIEPVILDCRAVKGIYDIPSVEQIASALRGKR
jgi:hypothetical protein